LSLRSPRGSPALIPRQGPLGRRPMTVAITRRELGAGGLRREGARCRDAKAARRMLASALVLEGAAREEAARAAGTDRQTLRERAHRYHAEGLAGLYDRHRPGPRPRLTPEQEVEPVAAVERGPDPDRDPRVGLRPPEGRLRGALAPGRPPGADRGPLRRPPARALGRQAAVAARRHAPVGPPRAPRGRRGGAGRLPASFPELVAAALPGRARGRPVESLPRT
jgi:putative transposase